MTRPREPQSSWVHVTALALTAAACLPTPPSSTEGTSGTTEPGETSDATAGSSTSSTAGSTTSSSTSAGPDPSTSAAPTTGEPSTGGDPECGDGQLDGDEACDDGPENSDNGACTSECEVATCGDGLLHLGVELCDDGDENGGGYGVCRDDCLGLGPHCGDGIVQEEYEDCDEVAEPVEGPNSGCLSSCRWASSCLEIAEDDPDTETGSYKLRPEGLVEPVDVFCDMETDGGGYTFAKIDMQPLGDGQLTAAEAEALCSALGLRLLAPRSTGHLTSSFGVAMNAAIEPLGEGEVVSSADYLSILGIYPKTPGQSCAGQPFNAEDCPQWTAAGGPFWISGQPIAGQPGSSNCAGCSMAYTWNGDGTVAYYEAFSNGGVGATSYRFICMAGDKLP